MVAMTNVPTMNRFLTDVFDDTRGGQLFSPQGSPAVATGRPYPEGVEPRSYSHPPAEGAPDLALDRIRTRARSSTVTLKTFVSRVFDDCDDEVDLDDPANPMASTTSILPITTAPLAAAVVTPPTPPPATDDAPPAAARPAGPACLGVATSNMASRSYTMPPEQPNVLDRDFSLIDGDTRPRSRSTMTSMTEEGLKSMNNWTGDLFGEKEVPTTASPGMTSSSLSSCSSNCTPHEITEFKRTVSDALAAVKAARLAKKKRQQSVIES